MGWEEVTIGACRLIRGDALDIVPHLIGIDAVLTDIPYGVGMRAFNDDLSVGIQALDLAPCRRAITWLSPGKIGPFVKASSWNLARVLWMEKTADLSYPWRGWMMNSEAILVLERLGAKWPTPESFHRDCYAVSPWGKNGHPNAKPLAVAKDLLQKLSAPHETILDMFAGSGTTAVACIALRRQFVGVEKEARWFDLMCRQVEAAYAQPDLFIPPPRPPQQARLFA